MNEYSQSYWMQVPAISGEKNEFPQDSSVVIIGSGLSGASIGYFLQQHGFKNVTLIDYQADHSASYRNAGHILHGTVESMKAMCEIHGREKAKELWDFSIQICDQIGTSIQCLGIDADYRQDGYLVIAISEVEDRECKASVNLLNEMGFQSEYVDTETVRRLGFNNCFGARYERGSAQAHPIKFRNGIINKFLEHGGKYYSNIQVQSLEETSGGVEISTQRGKINADAVVIAANAYSPLFSDFFRSRGLIDPFRGQIITSKPLKHRFQVKYPHSFDHGYEYALVTEDNRLLLGGWRNHSSTGETGTYSLEVNPFIENGLKDPPTLLQYPRTIRVGIQLVWYHGSQ